jgi:RNA polymerase sigma factor (sigma-70 family)
LGIAESDAANQMDAQLRLWQRAEGHGEISDALIERAAVRVYCCALHRGIGLEHTAAQERALIEIWNYITPIVRRYVRDRSQAESCANGVLLTVWQRYGTIRDPGSLLAFSAMTAARAAFRMLREDERYELDQDSAEAEENQNIEERSHKHATDDQPLLSKSELSGDRIHDQVEQESSRAAFEELIRRCLRSVAQQEVFIDLVLRDLSISEVAARLGITPNNVSVLKNRAKTALRRCRILVEALGRALVTRPEVGHDVC